MNAHIVVGLGFGDEGKGSWVDHLVRRHNVQHVVRFNGGAQALHHVVTSDGRTHGFSQFASGSFSPGVKTLLSRFVLIDPQYLFAEAERLEKVGVKSPLDRMIVSANAPIITPFNRMLNRIQEVARGGSKHGSCGFGIGITQKDVETLGENALYVRDLQDPGLIEKLGYLQDLRISEASQYENKETAELLELLRNVDLNHYVRLFAEFYSRVSVVSEEDFGRLLRQNDTVFEGAQGVLLDERYGFFPHCTRSTTTFKNAETLLKDAGFTGTVTRVGLLRGYGTRHGAGPFMTEDTSLTLSPCHNQTNPWQGQFRLGWFDAVAARYSLEVCGGVDTLAITNLDRMNVLPRIKVATQYDNVSEPYFSEGRFITRYLEYPQLAERTKMLASVQPRYLEVPGWNGRTEGMEEYLQTLQRVTGSKIHAYSVSTGPDKIYRHG